MSIGAFATLGKTPVVLLYIDVVLIVIAAVPALIMGAPELGYIVGGVAWILGRVASEFASRRIARMEGGVRRQLGYGIGFSMARVWVLAGAIVLSGVAGSRADGLTAALVIFAAFSLYFVRSAFGHMTQPRSTTP